MQTKPLANLGQNRHAELPAAVGDHEVDRFGARLFRAHKVAFVFTVFGIDDNNDLAGEDRVNSFFDSGKVLVQMSFLGWRGVWKGVELGSGYVHFYDTYYKCSRVGHQLAGYQGQRMNTLKLVVFGSHRLSGWPAFAAPRSRRSTFCVIRFLSSATRGRSPPTCTVRAARGRFPACSSFTAARGGWVARRFSHACTPTSRTRLHGRSDRLPARTDVQVPCTDLRLPGGRPLDALARQRVENRPRESAVSAIRPAAI